MKKKLISLLLACAVCVSLSACSNSKSASSAEPSNAGSDTESLKIGVIAKYQHEFYMTMFEGAKAAGSGTGR